MTFEAYVTSHKVFTFLMVVSGLYLLFDSGGWKLALGCWLVSAAIPSNIALKDRIERCQQLAKEGAA